jgi:multidrug resistance efflux pump
MMHKSYEAAKKGFGVGRAPFLIIFQTTFEATGRMKFVGHLKRLTISIFLTSVLLLLLLLFVGCPLGEMVVIKGEIHADTILVTAGASGEVERIEKGMGDRVVKGELILKIGLEDIEGKLKKGRERLDVLHKQMKKAKNKLEKSEKQIRYSRGRFLNSKRLFDAGAIAKKEVHRTREEYDFAVTLNERVKRDIAKILGEMEKVEGEILRAEEEYGSVFVLSPETGFIVKCFVWEGGYLLKGDDVVEIAKEGEVYFVGNTDIEGSTKRDIALGDDVFVLPMTLNCLASGTIPGYVSEIVRSGVGEDLTVEIKVRLRPKSRWEILALGLSEMDSKAVVVIP